MQSIRVNRSVCADEAVKRYCSEVARSESLVVLDTAPYDIAFGNHVFGLFVNLTHLRVPEGQASMTGRVRALRASEAPLAGSAQVFVVVRADDGDPAVDAVSWLNLEIAVAHQTKLLFTWSPEERFCALDGMARFQHVRDTEVAAPRSSSSALADPTSILVRAFTLKPQIVSHENVIRLMSRCDTVADFLQSPAEKIERVDSVGSKKAHKLHAVLNAPLSGGISVSAVIGQPALTTDGGSGVHRILSTSDHAVRGPSDPQPSAALQSALSRLQAAEDEDLVDVQ